MAGGSSAHLKGTAVGGALEPGPAYAVKAEGMYLFASDWEDSPRPAPEGVALFAVGDVHGRADLLAAMHGVLRREIEASGGSVEVVRIGDYIDRGPQPITALHLAARGLGIEGVSEVNLRGNHEQMLIDVLDDPVGDPDAVELWLHNGGDSVLYELGAEWALDPAVPRVGMRDILLAAMSEADIAFMRSLPLIHRVGGIVFAHAGVEPQRPLETARQPTLLWIRGPFLYPPEGWSHPFVVVHGHTVGPPEVLPHRIGIDTGAVVTGALTAVQIVDDRLRFLIVCDTPRLDLTSLFGSASGTRRYGEPQPLPT